MIFFVLVFNFSRLMIIRIFLFAIYTVQGQSVPFRSSVLTDWTISTKRFAWSLLVPRGTAVHRQKHILRKDFQVVDPVDDLIEKIPVFERMGILIHLIGTRHKDHVQHILHLVGRSGLPQLSSYIQNLIGNTYMEHELLAIIFRLVFSRQPYGFFVPNLLNPYRHLCAQSLLNTLREYAKEQWGIDLNFLSTRTLVDWVDVLQNGGDFRTKVKIEEVDRYSNTRSFTSRTFVFLERATWLKIFEKRLFRLSLTGYEDIDL